MDEIIKWLNKMAVTPEDEKMAREICALIRNYGNAKIYLRQILTGFENLEALLAED